MKKIIYLIAFLVLTLNANAQIKPNKRLEKDFGLSNLKLKPNSVVNKELTYIIGGTHKPFEVYNNRVRKRLLQSIVPITESHYLIEKSKFHEYPGYFTLTTPQIPVYIIEFEISPGDFEILSKQISKKYGDVITWEIYTPQSSGIDFWVNGTVIIEAISNETTYNKFTETRRIIVYLNLSSVKDLNKKVRF